MAEQDTTTTAPEGTQDAEGEVSEPKRRGSLRRSLSATGDAAMKSVNASGRTARKSADITGSAVQKSAKMTGGVVRKSVDATADAFDALQAAYNKGVDTVFPDCPVHAFLLPTGPDADDYLLTFDLDEFLANLQTGILVRPKIDLWAASAEGHDAHHLAQEVAARFAEELSAATERTVEEGEANIAVRQAGEVESLQDVQDELSGPTLRSAALWTGAIAFGATGPFILPAGAAAAVVVPCVLLFFGGKPRTAIFGRIRDYLRARSDRASAEKNLEQEVKRMEREFRRKRKPFERAVGRLEIRVHPRLQAAAAALRGEEAPAAAGHTNDVPDVERFLGQPAYRRALAALKDLEEETPEEPTEPPQSVGIGRFFRGVFGGG